MTDKDEQFPIKHHISFLNIAQRNCIQAQALSSRRPSLQEEILTMDREMSYGLVMENLLGTVQCAIVSIVFSLMALEAFINDYAISSASDKDYSKLKSLKKKYIKIPKDISGKQLDECAIKKLTCLIRLRKDYVHYKTLFRPRRDIGSILDLGKRDYPTEPHAVEAVETVDYIVKKMAELDPTIQTDWLEYAEIIPLPPS